MNYLPIEIICKIFHNIVTKFGNILECVRLAFGVTFGQLDQFKNARYVKIFHIFHKKYIQYVIQKIRIRLIVIDIRMTT